MAETKKAAEAETETTRYAVYDNTHLRFLTPTYDVKKDAEAVAKEREDLEVREV